MGEDPRLSRWTQSNYVNPFLSRDPFLAGIRRKEKIRRSNRKHEKLSIHRGRGHEPRKADGLQKLEKTREHYPLEPPEKIQPSQQMC